MKNLPRILFLIGSLSLLLVFAFPLWQITLFAPQYPDGITMFIWVNQISGNEEGILQNVNILNHYIGMAPIDPDSIPELKYFPYIIYGMVTAGIALFFTNRRYGFLIWTVVLIVLGILGVYDFYLWEYNYGHNLAADAPIKIPGMVYQPPLFGRKMLLNFEAFSYPHWGSAFLGLSVVLGMIATWLAFRQKRAARINPVVSVLFPVIFLASFLTGCSTDPVAVNYGEAHCDHCQMTIVDQKYGSELVTDKGKVYMFDAVECLLGFRQAHPDMRWSHVLVTGFDAPGNLIPAASSYYLRSEALKSPMGINLTAFADQKSVENFQSEHGGIIYSWDELRIAFPGMKPGQSVPADHMSHE